MRMSRREEAWKEERGEIIMRAIKLARPAAAGSRGRPRKMKSAGPGPASGPDRRGYGKHDAGLRPLDSYPDPIVRWNRE